MEAETTETPNKLAARSGVGAALTIASAFALYFAYRSAALVHSTAGAFVRSPAGAVAVCSFLLFGVGGWISWRSERQLKHGLEAELWSAEQVEALRRVLNRPIWTWASVALGLCWVLMIVFAPPSSIVGTATVLLMSPSGVVSRLRLMLRPPEQQQPWIDWRDMKPVRSEHWGDGGRP